jgi:hypothetical protein
MKLEGRLLERFGIDPHKTRDRGCRTLQFAFVPHVKAGRVRLERRRDLRPAVVDVERLGRGARVEHDDRHHAVVGERRAH